ncbi:MAG TPA: hypothetical protein ENN43_07030, partial [bacterium]|nr:hypothetical protein [bacterium]
MKRFVFLVLISIIMGCGTNAFGAHVDPVTGTITSYGTITSVFGPRVVGGESDFHHGLDYSAPKGTTVYAVSSGSDIGIGANIEGSGTGWWVSVGGVRYIHLKRSGDREGIKPEPTEYNLGVFRIANTNNYGIYVRRGEQYWVVCNAAHTTAARAMAHPYDIAENSYATSATAGDIIAVSGGSGYGREDRYTPHLHVNLSDRNQNPLRRIPYNNEPPHATISDLVPGKDAKLYIDSGIVTISARVDASAHKDVNRIEFRYRKKGDDKFKSIYYMQFDPNETNDILKNKSRIGDRKSSYKSVTERADHEKNMHILSDAAKTDTGIYPEVDAAGEGRPGKSTIKYNWKIINEKPGEYEIAAVVTDIRGGTAQASNSFLFVDKRDIPFNGRLGYERVSMSNPQQEPTAVPSPEAAVEYPSSYPVSEVKIDAFIKGLMLGMTAGANFSAAKYREGYKAVGTAAYTLLLNEIEKNKDGSYDILVNGYSESQPYYVPYIDFNSGDVSAAIKNAVTAAYQEISMVRNEDDGAGGTAERHYIKTFSPEKADVFTRSADNAEIPAYTPLVFPFVDAKGTTLVQSTIDGLGRYMAYLNTTRVDENVGVTAPQSLINCTKAGMSAFAAMKYADQGVPALGEKAGGGKKAEDILGYFYRPVPMILGRLTAKQGNSNRVIYDKEWGGARLGEDGKTAFRIITKEETR